MATDTAIETYVRAKHDVARLLRALQRLLQQRHGAAAGASVEPLVARLAADRFNLVVLGQFKRGKSSLINAILGEELLPTAAVPLTSAVTMLRYGPKRRVLIRHEGWVLPRVIASSTLAEYITERGNPGNEKQVLAAEIEMPEPFLRRGLHLVDTPGIGSVHRHNTATTYRFLPEADAVIFVTSAESPFSDAEAELLDTIREHVNKVFFVLNKVDQLESGEQQEVLDFLSHALAQRMGMPSLRLYPLSAHLALAAKRTNDAAMLRASGLPAFERQLAEFLANERGQVLLVRILDRALQLLADERKQVGLRAAMTARTPGEREQLLAAVRRQRDDLVQQQEAVQAEARGKVTTRVPTAFAASLATFAADTATALRTELTTLQQTHADESIDHYYQRARQQTAVLLLERGRSWLREQGDDLDALSTQHMVDLRAKLQTLFDEAPKTLAASLQVPAASFPGLEMPQQRDEVPSSLTNRFALPSAQPSDAPLYPLPDRFARRFLQRHLEAAIERDVAAAISALEQHIQDTLAWSTDRLGRAAREVTEQEFHQLEAVLQSVADAPPDGFDELVAEMAGLRDRLLAQSVARAPESVDDQNESKEQPREEDAPERLNADARCVICRTVDQATYDFLCDWQYQLAKNPGAQRAFAEGGGFCSIHTQQLEEVASKRGLAEGYAVLLDHFARGLRALAKQPVHETVKGLDALLPNTGRCPACAVARQAAARHLGRISAALTATEAPSADGAALTLCLPHLHAAVREELGDQAAGLLLNGAARHMEETSSALNSFALKIDARRRELLSPEEEGASHHAVVLVGGDQPRP